MPSSSTKGCTSWPWAEQVPCCPSASRSAEVVAYEDLGTEAIRRLEVEDFPVIVANDMYGNDLLEQGKARYQKREALGSYVPVGERAEASNGGGA